MSLEKLALILKKPITINNEIVINFSSGRGMIITFHDNYFLITLNDIFKKYINGSNILKDEYSEGYKKIFEIEKMQNEIDTLNNLNGYINRIFEDYI
jgi:hypothetical protein